MVRKITALTIAGCALTLATNVFAESDPAADPTIKRFFDVSSGLEEVFQGGGR